LVRQYGRQIGDMLRLRPGPQTPVAFLVLSLAGMLTLYCMGGCTIDFTTIRYLVPLWAVLPGLIAAVIVSRRDRPAAAATVGIVLAVWWAGQIAYFAQLGPPHPLENVAGALKTSKVEFALAEPLDAHLLSFLTAQQPRIGEYQSFWPRLAHFRAGMPTTGPMTYLVDTNESDWTRDWIHAGWPGYPPPETSRSLWSQVKRVIHDRPEEVLWRKPLTDGYVLVHLAHALPEQKAQ